MRALAMQLGAAVPAPESGIGFPRDVSAEGWRIDRIIEVASYPVVVIGVIATAWLVYILVAHRRREAAYLPGSSRRAMILPLAVATLIFFGIDGYLLVRSSIDLDEVYLRTNEIAARPDAVRVEINARQWAWDVRHPGADGRFATADDLVAVNELVIPVDRPVVVQMGASDVIHSLYLPNFRVKRDAIPGQITSFWFTATEPGTFEIGCAQHCGVGHYEMRGLVRVLPAPDYESWLAAAQEDARLRAAEAGAAEPGRGWGEGPWPDPPPTRDWGWPWQAGEGS